MSSVDDLIEEITRQRPEMSREEIEARIAAKREMVGANYLTDRGAVFLVASECGVTIGKPIRPDISIKELYAGANEVTLETRVMCVSPIKQYTRKDGGQGALRLMSVYDSPDHTASVKMWGEKAGLPGMDGLRPGDFVKITKAYVKEDRDGTLAIHIGSNATVEPVATPQREIPPIEDITVDVSKLAEEEGEGGALSNLAVSGIMEGDIALMEYTRQSGERATALKMRLRGSDGVSRRVVLWGKDMSSVPKRIVSAAPRVSLLGVSAKKSEQQGFEIHGNEATHLVIEGGGAGDGNGAMMEAITIRIIAKPPPTDGGRQAMLGVDSTKRLYSIIDKGQVSAAYGEGEIVECMPALMHGTMVTLDASSYIRNVEGSGAGGAVMIPTLSDMETRLMDAKPDGGLYCISCIVLNPPDRREIQTRSGDTVYLTEAGVGDGSGETVLKAWRNQSGMLDECRMGSKYMIAGVRAQQGMGGNTALTLTEYSVIREMTGE